MQKYNSAAIYLANSAPLASPPTSRHLSKLNAAGVCCSRQNAHKTLHQQVDSLFRAFVYAADGAQTLAHSKPACVYGLALSYWNVPSHTAERCERL